MVKIQCLQIDQLVEYPCWQGRQPIARKTQRLQVGELVKYLRRQGSQLIVV